jgi:hypothetical protein
MMHRNINYKDLDNYLISLGIKEQILKLIKSKTIILSNNQKYLEKLKTNWSLENVSKSFYNTANEFYKKQIIIFNYARPRIRPTKITGTPELVVDFATMFNESYIDPAEEMKQQPVALA